MSLHRILTNRRVRTGFYVFVIANLLISGSNGFTRANIATAIAPVDGSPVTICHATGSQSNPWTQLHTTEGAQLFNGHFENSGTPLHGHEEDLLLQGTVNCPDTGPHCSDGNIDTGLGEQCDDRNTTDGDGCDMECLIETGTLIVKKVIVKDNGGNSSAGNFSFSLDSGSPIVFESDGQNEVTVPSGVTHTVAEVADSGYATTYDSCTDMAVPKNGTATCTITNDDKPGTLIVKKTLINDDGDTKTEGDFSFQVDGGSPQSFESDGQNDLTVNAGTYTISETPDAGYTTSYDNCAGLYVPNGGTATCTITNDDVPPPGPTTGTLIVIKNLNNNDGGTASAGNFSFSVDGGSAVVFEADGENELTVTPGSHTVTETADSGYTTTYDNCTNVSVPQNGTATCTITNDDKPGTLIVKKTVINDDGGTKTEENFSFQVDGGSPQSFESDGQNDLTVNAGTYTVIENLNSGYTLSDVICVYENQSVGQSVNNGKEVTIDNGDTVTCTFTNTFTPPLPTEGTLIVKKLVLDGGETDDPSDFSIHVLDDGSDVASSPQSGSGTGTSYILQAGAYQVQEQDPGSNWQVAYGNDDNCASDGDIMVVAGEIVTCTVINTFAPTPPSTFTLNLTKSGPGKGGVDNDKENGTWCDENCAENAHTYATGTVVTLTANPSSGSSFEGSWSGACNGTGTCVVTMNSNQTVNAHFSLQSTPPPPCTENCGGGGGGGGGRIDLSIFNEATDGVTIPTALISWFTNLNATCHVVYGTSPQETNAGLPNYGYPNTTGTESNPVTYHTTTLTDLEEGTTYYWRPICTASGQTEKAGAELHFVVAAGEQVQVLGFTTEPEDPKVLGFESLPTTSGDFARYYVDLLALFAVVMTCLALGYRRTKDEPAA